MHQGVIRDMEQQRIKRERQADFDMQRELEAEYKREQTVRDSTAEGAAILPRPTASPTGTGR
jgi:protein PET117